MHDDFDIGARLRTVREAAGVSQRELMRRTGISNATISLIESGQLSPTFGALKRILAGMPMGLAEFFSGEAVVREDRIFFGSGDLLEMVKGGVSYRQIGRTLKGKAIQFLHERYEPGAATGKHPLTHEGEECGIVISGRLRVTVGERSRVLGPGEAYYFRSDQAHSFRNEGSEPCELVSACTPPSI
jgi:transcriptional regulator with XRE-family HTH domain